MPHLVDAVDIQADVETVFTWFRDPANWLHLAPPALHLEIVAAPPLLEQGSRLELKSRRSGMVYRTTMEITGLEPGKLLIEEQRAGPFRQWKHSYRFAALGDGATRLTEEVIFEPPVGLLGFIVTASYVEKELAAFFHYRRQRLRELLDKR
jgi:uncharacterized protein